MPNAEIQPHALTYHRKKRRAGRGEWWATKTRFAPKVLRAKLLARTPPYKQKLTETN